MWVDVLLLANLAKHPSHGYELRRRVEESSGYALSNNSLYPALRRFSEAGAVIKTPEKQEGRPPRHVYTLTDVGRELLHDMLAELPDELAGDAAEFFSRLAHFGWLEPAERLRVLDARARALQRREERLTLLQAGGGTGSGEDSRDGEEWRLVTLDQVVRQLHEELNWLADLRKRLEYEELPVRHPAD